MAKIRVAVLRGGPSAEYEISLMTGENVLKFLPKDKYQARDVLISKDGVWHMDGFPTDPAKIFRRVDAVFNALHGEYGEDGIVQQILEGHKIPYTGSGILASAMAMKKSIAKDVYKKTGLKTPRGLVVKKSANLNDSARDINETLFPPWIIKPAGRGSSVGVAIAKDVPEIPSVIEIIPPDGNFFNYEVKYNGATKEICPAHLDDKISKEIQEMAVRAHSALGL